MLCPPRGAARFSSFASPAESHEHDLLAERAVAQAALFRFSSFVGPPRSEDLFAEARRAPALAALLGLRSEDLFVEGPPGSLERAGRPSPNVADLVRICC